MRLFLIILFPIFAFASSLTNAILSEMSLEEKIGQLFVMPACPLEEASHRNRWVELMQTLHIGNAIVKQSDPATQIEFLNYIQEHSKWPLLVVADAEWGLGMRMKDTISFPKNMTLGAIQNRSLLEEFGAEIAREARLVGIHMNLAPVMDINSNPGNLIIHTRAFGDKASLVAECGAHVIRGMEKKGLYTCAKHFPGHGNTDIDSHSGLPLISYFSNELHPFKEAISKNVTAIMSAHILVPTLDPDLPATLSYPILTSLLREELSFQGLILTDALNMQALTTHFSTEEIALKAHMAGADLLLYGDHISSKVASLLNDQIPTAYQTLLDFYRNQPTEKLDAAVRRILEAKETLGLFEQRTVAKDPLLNTAEALALKETLFQEAITQLGGDFAPIDENTRYISIGDEDNDFLKEAFSMSATGPQTVIAIRGLNHRKENFGLSSEALTLMQTPEAIFCVFGTPYVLSLLPPTAKVLIAYEEDEVAQKTTLEILKGKRKAVGLLPIDIIHK